MSLFGGYFVYFSPVGFPGSSHDKRMWDLEAIPLERNEFGIADKGYEGVLKLRTPWKGVVRVTSSFAYLQGRILTRDRSNSIISLKEKE